MELLLVIGFLALTYAVLYLPYHFIRKIKDKERVLPKKLFYSLLIGGILAFSVGGTFTSDSTTTSKLAEAEKENELLTEKIEEINHSFEAVQEDNEQLKLELAEQTEVEETIAALDKENDKLKSEKSELDEKIKELTGEISDYEEQLKDLNKSVANHKEDIKDLEDKVAELESQAAAPVTKEVTDSTSSTNSNTETTSAEDSGECNIKGSVNNIYHLPGGAYYERTKNVVSWFCSEKEAQDAGYRKSKR